MFLYAFVLQTNKMTILTVLLATLCILGSVASAPQPRIDFENVIFVSNLDKKVITVTEYLEDPGPYNVYGSIAQADDGLPQQRWRVYMYTDSTIQVSAHGGQYLNTFSTYKPCQECFSASENWKINVHNSNTGKFEGNVLLNSTATLQSTWTNLCLINPGNNYLTKGACDSTDTRQIWTIIWSQ